MIDILNNMLKDLSEHKRNKNDLLLFYIDKRLDKSLHSYYDNLIKSVNYINTVDKKKIIHDINR